MHGYNRAVMSVPRCILAIGAVAALTVLSAQEPVDYPYDQIYTQQGGHRFQPTVREECRSVVLDSAGNVYTVGVQSNGPDTLNATRQFVSLGRWQRDHWSAVAKVSLRDGYAYSPAMAADGNGGLWIAWSEFNQVERDWAVYARYWDGDSLGSAAQISTGLGPDMRPTVAVRSDGTPVIAWETAERGAIRIAVASRAGGRWNTKILTPDVSFNFRPNLAVAPDGTVWLAYDRWVDGDYDVFVRTARDGEWSDEIAFFASPQDEQRPTIRFAADGTAWIHSSKRVEGTKDGQRYTLPAAAAEFIDGLNRLDEFQIDRSGRFWFLHQAASFHPGNPGYRAGRTPTSAGAWFDGQRLQPFQLEVAIGYRAPTFVGDGSFWHATDMMVYRKVIEPVQATVRGEARPGPLGERKSPRPLAEHMPHETLEVGGETYTLFFGELHTHLGEYPSDRIIELWTDRYYLNAMRSQVLDIAASSDHDWPWMTNSKYRVEQAYAKVFSFPGKFEGFTSYEWSGDAAGRRRYGDRTIVFSRSYNEIFRITDPASNEVEELHRLLADQNAIDWAHHVGAPWGVMDWTKHDPVAEPVMEITSGHGIYETYDRSRAVPDWLRRPPVGKSSIQDGLSYGKKFGFVGSSDRHDGISGYDTGMFGVFAKDLSRESVVDALRARRSFAIRGGEPMLVDFRVNGVFQGGEAAVGPEPPLLSVSVRAQSPVAKIEVVRNGSFVYTHTGGGGKQTEFEYRDTTTPESGSYYYVRVWLEGRKPILQGGRGETGKYAWSSPVWIQ